MSFAKIEKETELRTACTNSDANRYPFQSSIYLIVNILRSNLGLSHHNLFRQPLHHPQHSYHILCLLMSSPTIVLPNISNTALPCNSTLSMIQFRQFLRSVFSSSYHRTEAPRSVRFRINQFHGQHSTQPQLFQRIMITTRFPRLIRPTTTAFSIKRLESLTTLVPLYHS